MSWRSITWLRIFLRIHPGERAAIVGPGGVDKTRTLSLILRFCRSSAGEIYFDGGSAWDYHGTMKLVDHVGGLRMSARAHAFLLQKCTKSCLIEDVCHKIDRTEYGLLRIQEEASRNATSESIFTLPLLPNCWNDDSGGV